MIVCLALSPALDLTYRVGELRLGEVNRVGAVLERAGGKGVNVADVARRLGSDTRVVVALGGATGQAVRAHLAAESIRAEVVRSQAATRRTVTVVDSVRHPTGIYEPPAELTAQEWDQLVACATGGLDQRAVLVVSGSAPSVVGRDAIGDLVARTKHQGAGVLVDTSGPALLAAAEAGATVLKPNAAELREATGEADWRDGVRRLVRAGAGAVLVSFGAEGLVLCTAGRAVRARLPAAAGNPTGAGDAVVAALAAALLAARRPEEIVRHCAAVGAAAVLQPVAGVVDPDDVARLEETVDVEEELCRW